MYIHIPKVINVNQLLNILGKEYGEIRVINKIEVADTNRQFDPKEITVGIGGVLNIYFEVYGRDDGYKEVIE